jgi:hypothetical protein
MRKFIAIAIVSLALFSCGGGEREKLAKQNASAHHMDSTVTVARYVLGNTGRVDEQQVKRFIKDTFVLKTDSTGNQIITTKVPGKDTVYRIPLFDTLRGSDKKPVYDSAGKVKMQLYFYDLPAKWVLIDYNKSF